MSNVRIPSALGPNGNIVPIEEAIRFKTNYYRCPECAEIVNPRKGPQRQFFAHKKGVLDNTECSLSYNRGVEQMVQKFRESEIQKQEQEKRIRVYLGKQPGGRYELFGVIPSLDWSQVPTSSNIDTKLAQLEVEANGVDVAPTGRSFHPSEAEARFELDPTASEFSVSLDGPAMFDSLLGTWTAPGLSTDDLFVGDQTRARRRHSNHQVKLGKWVYAIEEEPPAQSPDEVTVIEFTEYTLLAFPAKETTAELIDSHGSELTTDKYGFDADVIVPSHAHPTAETPIRCEPGSEVLISVTPAPEIDPIFEIIPLSAETDGTTTLDRTGPGNPRYHTIEVPSRGNKRVTIHQRNSTRHRLVHINVIEDDKERTVAVPSVHEEAPGLQITENDTQFISPLGAQTQTRFGDGLNPMRLPAIIDYVGPSGLELEVTGKFTDTTENSDVKRSTDNLDSLLPTIGQWVRKGCQQVRIHFDGIGDVGLRFDQVSSQGAD